MTASVPVRVDVVLRTCCVLLCIVAGSRQLSISELVVPEAVEAGSDAELQCRYGLDANDSGKAFIKWWWTPDPATDRERKQIYQRFAGHVPVAMQHNVEVKDNDTIVLMKMKPMDSGMYECEVSEDDEVRKHEELTVYTKGTGPQLNITTVADGDDEDDDEDVLIKCQAEQVAPLPDLVVFINDENINVTVIVVDSNDGLYGVYANVTLSKKDVNGAQVRCQLLYANTTITHPLFEATEVFNPSGAALSTTEAPENTTEAVATLDSLQNMRDTGSRVHGSWVLLIAVTLLTKLLFFECSIL